MHTSRITIGAAALACLALAVPSAGATTVKLAAADPPVVTLDLEFNEAAGATVAQDSSGFDHDGRIGNHIKMNGSYADWDRHPGGTTIYYGADHLVMVDDAADGSLDPGTGNFTVEIRIRTKDSFGNIIQKGQARTVGGQVKFQAPKGVVSCLFKSPSGNAGTGSKTPLNDNQWHTIRCVRTPTDVTMYVDGVFRNRIRHTTGNINNVKPWTIGGKFDCDTSNPGTGADSCDYYPGDIDYVRITKG